MIALASPASLLAAVSAWEASASAATGLSGTYLRYVISFFLRGFAASREPFPTSFDSALVICWVSR